MSALIDDVGPADEAGADAAADLRELEMMAAGDPQAQPLPGAAEAAPVVTLDKEIAGALMMISAMVAPFLPTVAKVYSKEACEAVGAAVAPVCEKHGWLSGGVGGEYGEELMCLVVIGPMAFATYHAASGDIAALKEKNRAEDERNGKVGAVEAVAGPTSARPGALAVPGSDTVSFGAPV